MKSRTGHLFTRTIIILMIFFVSLPCSVKREVKEVLNIPVAFAVNAEKPDKGIVCPSFIKEKKQTKLVSYLKKEAPSYPGRFDFSFLKDPVFQYNNFSFSGTKKPSPVLIYILHEQYLI